MKIEEIKQIATSFGDLVTEIKNGNLTIDDLKNQLLGLKTQLVQASEVMPRIYNGEDLTGLGISDELRNEIFEQMQTEMKKFDYKESKKGVITILEIVKQFDDEIGESVILPFMMDLFEITRPFLKETHAESEKAIRKGIKKFEKLNGITV